MSLPAGTRFGPYEIVAPLGAGGMGEVYRARDGRLGREVAVKVLPPGLAADSDRLRRFEQEARAASALNHPNILAVHDVGSASLSSRAEGGASCGAAEVVHYIVTELLEGESLRDRIKGGPLPARKAIELAVQVASGLAAAHEKGIIHRDLKPENLFVTKDGQVKILDFGLAKLTTLREEQPPALAPTAFGTEPGIVMGTVAYMSPEQVRGQNVDHRSDIFSLGVVLYEMVTGRHAFARETGAETMTAILKEEPPEPSSIEGGVPPALSRSIAHCLEKSPEERFQSARDLAFDLKAIVADTGGTRAGTAFAHTAPRRRLVWLAAGGAAALVVAAGAFFYLRSRTPAAGATLEPKRVVVAVFENQTGDESLDPLGRMASDWITQGLSRVEGLEVVPSTSVLVAQPPGSPAPSVQDPLRLLAEDTGAGVVVSGNYYVQGLTLYFQARISDAIKRKLIYALDPASGSVAAPVEAIDTLRRGVMGALAASFEARQDITFQQRPPTYEAYREFINGFELFLADDAESLRHMERAAEIDPDFVTPLLWAAYLRRVRGDWAEVEAIFKRLTGKRDLLTPLGRQWLDGGAAWGFHRYGEALKYIRGAQRLAPRDPLVNHWLGILAIFANRPEEAAATFASFPKQPWGNHPLGAVWISLYCDSFHMQGRYERELEEARRVREQFAENADVRYSEVSALAALGRLDELRRALEEIAAAQMNRGTAADAMIFAAGELRAHGRREESLRLAERVVTWYRGRPAKEMATEEFRRGLAMALFWAERWEDSRALFESLVAGGSSRVGDAGMVGITAARAGDRAAALKVAGDLERLDRKWLFGEETWYRACIAASLGDKEKAMELLREAFAQGQAYGTSLHTSLGLELLHGYPPFEEFLRPKG
ncbi:MAG: serine/threonine-protein kinase [Acidobacteriota bacterium]